MEHHEIQFQVKRQYPKVPLTKWRSIILAALALTLGVSCERAYREFIAFDSYEDIFYDLGESDPSVGFRLLHRRWNSFKPFILPNTDSMRTARLLSGCCLLLRFSDQLCEEDKIEITAYGEPKIYDDEYQRELKQLIRTKVQIQAKGIASLRKEQKEFWEKQSGNFGNGKG